MQAFGINSKQPHSTNIVTKYGLIINVPGDNLIISWKSAVSWWEGTTELLLMQGTTELCGGKPFDFMLSLHTVMAIKSTPL